tara:strand:- start:209 stop:769 length:561 start_codon:yes stop_codon:yes gene_type:complete
MRIISGKYKGKKLFLPNDNNTRPLRDMVKESIFNLINHSNKIDIDIQNSYILDLFSGSGSFGLECLSRGAFKVIFLENYQKAIEILKKNLNLIKYDNRFQIIKKDCFEFFESNKKFDGKFDIIFIDPPFRELRINNIIEKILEKKVLNKNGIMIVHRHKKDISEFTSKIEILEERKYGVSNIFFMN